MQVQTLFRNSPRQPELCRVPVEVSFACLLPSRAEGADDVRLLEDPRDYDVAGTMEAALDAGAGLAGAGGSVRVDRKIGEYQRLDRVCRPAIDVLDAAERGIEPADIRVVVQGRRSDEPVALSVPGNWCSYHDAEPRSGSSQRALGKVSRCERLHGIGLDPFAKNVRTMLNANAPCSIQAPNEVPSKPMCRVLSEIRAMPCTDPMASAASPGVAATVSRLLVSASPVTGLSNSH